MKQTNQNFIWQVEQFKEELGKMIKRCEKILCPISCGFIKGCERCRVKDVV